MDTLDYILASVTIISFGFGVYQLYQSRINKVNERANVDVLHEKLGGLREQVHTLVFSIDAIVKAAKGQEVTNQELRYMAEVARNNAKTIHDTLKVYRESLHSWQFGKFNTSLGREEDTVTENSTDKLADPS